MTAAATPLTPETEAKVQEIGETDVLVGIPSYNNTDTIGHVVRAVSAGAGFLVERQVVLLVWLAGLLIAGAVFAWVARRSLRLDDSPSSLSLIALTGLLLASPLALMLLQHPAH